MLSAAPQRKRPFDIWAYPIDFSVWLPAGVLIGSASGSAVDEAGQAAAIVAAASVRAGNQIVDVVLTGGVKGKRYTASLQIVTDATPGPTRPQLQIDFFVTVV